MSSLWHRVSATVKGVIGCTCAALIGVALIGVAVTAAQPTSVWSGVYAAQQAVAGEKIYFARCASCHGDDLGGVERAPALAGAAFLDSWHGKDVRRLLDRIDAMPPDAPKTLSPDEAIAVLAFLLHSSDVPSGAAPLPTDRTRLATIVLERSKP